MAIAGENILSEFRTNARNWPVFAALTLSAFCWGSSFAVVRVCLRQLTPLQMLAWQSLIAAVMQAVFSLLRGGWSGLALPRGVLLPMILLGLAGQCVLNGLCFLGLAYTTATNAALIFGFSPVMIALFAALFLGERFGVEKRLAAAVGFAGVALVVTGGRLNALHWGGMTTGNLVELGAASYWAAYSVLTRVYSQRVSPAVYTTYLLTLGAVVPWVLVSAFAPVASHSIPHGVALAGVIYLAFSSTFLAMNLWNWGLSRIEASRVGVFSYLEPVFAASIGILFLGERPGVPGLIGAVLVLGSIGLSSARLGRSAAAGSCASNQRPPGQDAKAALEE
jgi:drug/metabolite transporter (DMT)-like permease